MEMNAFFRKTVAVPYKLTKLIHKIAFVMFMAGVAAADEIVILAFGDSLTYGYGLAEADGFVPQLEHWLADAGLDVRVINAGVSGDTTAGGLARLEWVLAADVDAVILELGANDFLRGLSPAEARGNLDAMLTIITGNDLPVLVTGMPAPPNFGAEYKVEFDAIYPALAAKYQVPLYPFFMNGIALQRGEADVYSFIQPDGLHPNAAGVLLMVADVGPSVLRLVEGID